MNNTTLKKFSVFIYSNESFLQVGVFECTKTSFKGVWENILNKICDVLIAYSVSHRKNFKPESISFYKNVNSKELEHRLSFDFEDETLRLLLKYKKDYQTHLTIRPDLRKFLFD